MKPKLISALLSIVIALLSVSPAFADEPTVVPNTDKAHSETTQSATTAVWLYAALGLAAIAFGVGGTAAARRSR